MPNEASVAGGNGDASVENTLHRSFTFPRSRRLLAHKLFQALFNEGGEVVGRSIIVWVSRTESCKGRMGVVATKRTFHDAVDRNRAKRLIRESFRLIQNELIEAPWDMVILARGKILSLKQPEVQKELVKLCRRKGILKGSTP